MKGYQTHLQKGILLNANEASENVKPAIMQEILESIANLSFNRYPDPTCQKLHEMYAKIIGVKPSWILSGNGSDQMLGFLIQYYVQNHKKLFTLDPDFSMYDYYVEMNHGDIEKYSCKDDGSFDVDDFISEAKKANADMILFSNPNNPTGHSIGRMSMKKILNAFDSIPVVFDEAYMEFGKESAIDLLETYHNAFVCRTLSKAYGLAGIRCGFLIGQQVENLSSLFVPYALSSVTQAIACVVLKHENEYQTLIQQTIAERERVYGIVKDFSCCQFYKSDANFIYGKSRKKNILMNMFQEFNIVIRDYPDDSFRITIGTKEQNNQVLNILRRFEYENS